MLRHHAGYAHACQDPCRRPALVGRADVLKLLDFDAAAARGGEKIQHPGMFNANPASAAAGVAPLERIAASDPCAVASRTAERLNETLEAERVSWAVYGTFSGIHVFTNPERRPLRPIALDPFAVPYRELRTKQSAITHRLRLAMLIHGVNLNNGPGGVRLRRAEKGGGGRYGRGFRDVSRLLKREGDVAA